MSDKTNLISTAYKFLGRPSNAILIFVVLQEALSGLLLHQASNVTSFLSKLYHFHKLPILVREIRGQFISSLITVLCVAMMSRITPHIKVKTIGLTGKMSFAYFTIGFAAQVAIVVTLALLVDRHRQIFGMLHTYPKVLAFEVFVWCLLIGITEETIFRGYVLQVLEAHWGSAVALVLSSILFGLVHFQNQGETALEVVVIGLTGGLPYAAAYLMTRSLWLPIGLHCGWDFVADLLFGDKGVPPAVPQVPSLVDLQSLDAALQIVPLFVFVLVAMRTGRWVGKNPLAPAKPLAASAPTSSPE